MPKKSTDSRIQELLTLTADQLGARLQEMWDADSILVFEPMKRCTDSACKDCLAARGAENACKSAVEHKRAGCYRPIHEWPPIWRKMVSKIKVKEDFTRSTDGEAKSWDKTGQTVEIEWVDTLKLAEILGKHKKLDAWVHNVEKHEHVHLHLEVEKKLTAAREKAALSKIEQTTLAGR